MVVISDVRGWADAVAGLEPDSPLPTRVVLVPSEAHAHALRRELVDRAPHALVGTRFFTAAAAARAVLDAAGIAHELGEEMRQTLRIRNVLRTNLELTMLHAEDLRTRGWEEALASSLEQLELAGMRPGQVDGLASDLATIWREVDRDAAASWTLPRAIAEAAAVLEADPSRWPFDGPVLASVGVAVDAAHARLVRAIPETTIALLAGRPARTRAVERTRTLLGTSAIADVGSSGTRSDELGLLHEYLFASPDRLASPERRRSAGPDGSVSLELHAGLDEELDATMRWVADEVFERRTPLQELGILVPTADPFSTLIASRIRELPWPEHVEPVYLASGRPASTTSEGARLLALVQALRAFLPRDAVLELLPRLRLADRDDHLYPGRARAVVEWLGTSGGSPARREGAVEWSTRARRPGGDEWVTAVTPALAALVEIVVEMTAGASLMALWAAIRGFVKRFLIGTASLFELVEQLDHELNALAADRVAASIVGTEALELVVERIQVSRIRRGRYGEASIFVGTVTSAAGLSFTSVRIIGLSEGSFPRTLREDPLLPAEERRRLPALALDEDYAIAQLHAFDQIVRGTARSLVLSAPRTELGGSEREPAAVFVEVAAALGRPNAVTGAPARVVPTIADLERDAFAGARARLRARRSETPLSEACWSSRVAAGHLDLPSSWSVAPVIDPIVMAAQASSFDGILGAEPLAITTPGTSPESPFSASALALLLGCPQRFLFERLLALGPRRDPPSGHRIDPPQYGALFHRVAETFAREHGSAFGERTCELSDWVQIIDLIACDAFDVFASGYPFASATAIRHERRRLRDDARSFVEIDWNGGQPRRFVVAEHEFTTAIPTSVGPMFLRGRLDRVDVDGGIVIVRDLKTGRAHPRERDESDPDVRIDLQLAIYVAATRALASELALPAQVTASYVYVDRFASDPGRAFRDDVESLEAAGARWLDIAMRLVREQSYVKTPDSKDCRYCPFSPVCGDETRETAEWLERAESGAVAAFRELKS